MINANEARNRTKLHADTKDILNRIEDSIKTAIDNGMYNTKIYINLCDNIHNCGVRDTIISEMGSLGYNVNFVFAKPCPSGCPFDQWDPYNGFITISWENKEKKNE